MAVEVYRFCDAPAEFQALNKGETQDECQLHHLEPNKLEYLIVARPWERELGLKVAERMTVGGWCYMEFQPDTHQIYVWITTRA